MKKILILTVLLPLFAFSQPGKQINNEKILNIIPNLDKDKLGYILNEDKNFQYIARHLSPNVAKNINKSSAFPSR